MTAEVPMDGPSRVVVRHGDAISGQRIDRVRVIVEKDGAAPDTAHAPADSVLLVGLGSGEWIVHSAQIGYHARLDTLALRESQALQVLIPLYPMATDECGLAAQVWEPWWKIW